MKITNKFNTLGTHYKNYYQDCTSFKIKTTKNNQQFKLYMLEGTNQQTFIDWGDNNISKSILKHTYSIPGQYIICICGPHTHFQIVDGGADLLNLDYYVTEVYSLYSGITNLKSSFQECVNLTTVHSTFKLPSKCTSIYYLFKYNINLVNFNANFIIPSTCLQVDGAFHTCNKLEKFNGYFQIANNITSLYMFFSNCTKLKQIPNKFNIPSACKNIGVLFNQCRQLSSISNDLYFPSANCSYYQTFQNCSKLQLSGLLDKIIGNDTCGYSLCFNGTGSIVSQNTFELKYNWYKKYNINDWTYAFYAQKIITVPQNFYIPSTVRKLEAAFSNITYTNIQVLSSLLDKSNNIDETKTDITGVFSGIRTLQQYQLVYNWYKKHQFKNWAKFFAYLNLSTVPSSFVIPDYVTSIAAFFSVSQITTIPSTFVIPSSVINCNSLFSTCLKLKQIPRTFKFPQNVQYINQAFYMCSVLKTIPSTLYIPSTINTCQYLFRSCNITDIQQGFSIPCPSAKNFQGMFYYCTKLSGIPSSFIIPNGVTNAASLFQNCNNLKNIPETFILPSSITNINYMCQNNSNLEYLPKDIFKYITKISNLNSAFQNCSKLKNNINQVLPSTIINNSNFNYTYYNCQNLTGTVKDIWNKPCNNHTKTFYNCIKLDNYLQIPYNWK